MRPKPLNLIGKIRERELKGLDPTAIAAEIRHLGYGCTVGGRGIVVQLRETSPELAIPLPGAWRRTSPAVYEGPGKDLFTHFADRPMTLRIRDGAAYRVDEGTETPFAMVPGIRTIVMQSELMRVLSEQVYADEVAYPRFAGTWASPRALWRFNGFQLVIEACEYGGGTEDGHGRAVIVCGDEGQKLIPNRVWYTEGGMHAEFVLDRINTVVVARAPKKPPTYAIYRHGYTKLGPVVTVERYQLWHGKVEDVEHFLPEFAQAVQAGLAKASTIHCDAPSYFEDPQGVFGRRT